MYRWYVADPIRFDESIRWTIEHGHANNYGNDYASVAFWYQDLSPTSLPPLPERDAMRPSLPEDFAETRLEVLSAMARFMGPPPDFAQIGMFAEPFHRGEFAIARERIAALDQT